jgi:lysophospholipase L1-like esterase
MPPAPCVGARRPARTLLAAGLGCLLALALLVPAAADAACGKTKRFAASADAGLGTAPLAIGDSVLLGAAEETAAAGYDVDVRGCRQIAEGLTVLRKRARAGALPRVVVIALGSNSSITLADVRAALRILGPSRILGLVTPREIRGTPLDDAATLRSAATRWPRRIALVDWVEHTKHHRGLTYSDGIHLTPAGQRALAELLEAPLARARPGGDTPPPPSGGGAAGGGAKAP